MLERDIKQTGYDEINTQKSKGDLLENSTLGDINKNRITLDENKDIISTEENKYNTNQKIWKNKVDTVKRRSPGKLKNIKEPDLLWAGTLDGRAKTELGSIEELIGIMESDTASASHYKRVKAAIAIYRSANGMEEKLFALNGLMKSAENYLLERGEDSYESREINCTDIMKKIGGLYNLIGEDEAVKKDFRSADYVINADHLTEAQIKQEIRFAYKLVHGKKSALNSVPSKRISAFRRKKDETKKAQSLKEHLRVQEEWIDDIIEKADEKYDIKPNNNVEDVEEYEAGVKAAVASYRTILNLSDEESASMYESLMAQDEYLMKDGNKNELSTEKHIADKVTALEGVLSDILSWDVRDFAYKTPREFFEKDNLQMLYDKLSFAKDAGALLDELIRIGNVCHAEYELTGEQIGELRSRIGLFTEMEADYRQRINIAKSPYYALLLEEDLGKMSMDDINRLQQDDELPKDFKDYVSEVYAKNFGIVPEERADGVYSRGKNIKKLLTWHRRKKIPFDSLSPERQRANYRYDHFEADKIFAQAKLSELRERIRINENDLININEEEKEADNSGIIIEEKEEIIENNPQDEVFEEIEEKPVEKSAEQLQKEEEERQRQKQEEEKEKERQKKAEEQTKLRNSMNEIGQRYDKLFTKDANDDDAKKVRDDLMAMVLKLAGKDLGDMQFLPTDKLDAIIRSNIENVGKDNFSELIAENAALFKNEFEGDDSDYDTFRGPIDELSKKAELTQGEKLKLYEYSLAAIKNNTEMENLQYDSLLNMGLDKLSSLAKNILDYDESCEINEEGSFEDTEEEIKAKHISAATKILAEFSNEPAELFLHIPIDELSDCTADAYNVMLNDAEFKAEIDKTVKRAKDLKAKKETIAAAVDSKDREKLIKVITDFTGKKANVYASIPTVELLDMTEAMMDDVANMRALKNNHASIKKSITILHTEEYVRDRALYYNKRLFDELEDGGKNAQNIAWFSNAFREFGILYLKKVLGKKLSDKAFDGMSNDDFYTVFSNVGVIKALAGDNLDEYEKEDKAKAMDALCKIKLAEDLKTIIETALGEKLVPPVKKEVPKNDSYGVLYGGKVSDTEIWKNENTEKIVKGVNLIPKNIKKEDVEKDQKLAQQKHMDVLREFNKQKGAGKKNQIVGAVPQWSENAKGILSLAGDLIGASVTGTKNQTAVIKEIFLRNWKVIRAIAKNRAEGKEDPFSEIFSGITNEQRVLFMGENNNAGVKAVVDEVVNFLFTQKKVVIKEGQSINLKLTRNDVTEILNSKELDAVYGNITSRLEASVNALEQDVVEKMTQATADIFDQVESEGLESIIEDKVKDKEEKKLQDNLKLDRMQSALLYDQSKGQGKFIQTLVQGYYKNSSKEDQRFMLSFVIKDLKHKTEKKSDEKQGGEYFASAMKGAGPLMQKLLQGVPDRILVPEMKEALQVVKSSLRPIDESERNRIFEKIKKDSKGTIDSITDIESLGAASVAETFKCTVSGRNLKPQEVVIKIKRPDAEARMKKELNYIRRCAMYADMSESDIAMYEFMENKERARLLSAYKKQQAEEENLKKEGKKTNKKKSSKIIKPMEEGELLPHEMKVTESGFMAQYGAIIKEFDFKNEIANAERGEKNYIHAKRKVNTVKINKSFKKDSEYIAMNKAPGMTVDRYIKVTNDEIKTSLSRFKNNDPSIKDKYSLDLKNIDVVRGVLFNTADKLYRSMKYHKYVSDLAYQWVRQALFGSFSMSWNGDNFHHGDLHSGNIMINNEGTTVLDYGNCTVLTDNKVKQILCMMVSVVVSRADYFVEAFDNLLGIAVNEDGKNGLEKSGYAKLTSAQTKAFTKKLDEIFKLGDAKDSGKKIMLALTIAQELGIKLPKEIQNFSQCEQRLENTVLEMKQCCIDAAEAVEQIIRMPVESELKDFPDPTIMMHRLLSVRYTNKKYVCSYGFAFKKVKGEFQAEILDNVDKDINKLDEENGEQRFESYYIPGYKEIKNEGLMQLSKYLPEIKKYFYEIRSYIDKDEEVPRELKDKLNLLYKQIQGPLIASAGLNGLIKHSDIGSILAESLSNTTEVYSVDDFNELIYLIEKKIPAVVETGDKFVEYMKEKSAKKPDTKSLSILKSQLKEATTNLVETQVLSSPALLKMNELLQGNRTKKEREDFKAKIRHIIIRNADTDNKYNKYNEAADALEEANKSGNKEMIAAAQIKLDKAKKAFLLSYARTCGDMLEEEKLKLQDVGSPKILMNNEVLPDFVYVMGECLDNHWARSFNKLGKKYKIALDEAEEKQKLESEKKNKEKK